MHDFRYENGELFCESVRVRDIAKKVGTPFYVYSYKTVIDHFEKLKQAFRPVKPIICFSVKANSNLSVLRSLVKAGSGLDIVSGGELFRAKQVKCPSSKIVYAGVGKTVDEIMAAIRAKILLFNVESAPELARIQRIAYLMGKKVNVSLRINPAIDPETHDHIATGKKESKFGLEMEEADRIFENADQYPNVSLCGVHVHIGSQIVSGEPFVRALRKVMIFILNLEKKGHKIKYLNLGGGMGIVYSDEHPQTADEYAKKILPLIRRGRYQVILEPGRFIVGNAGIFVTRVVYIKKTQSKNFAIVDGGMNDLIRPAFYGSFHDVWPLVKDGRAQKIVYDVVGPICESSDFLAKNRLLQELDAGDEIALASAGAYGFSMSSNYNARPRVCEVFVHGSKFEIVRRRETYQDLIRGEKVPAWLK
ncbi:MAG: diaminopimelate decarboxylase [Omnitrophica bacterium RIFCSPLOWO2_12_FULL_44_17]|uniref:Diaminopimelate decarboxylase n=1 Tax=Candidatus Danuiimicrobium aquiferis TaxID=1801832 RepID=A0A1G1L1L4_9BACT|nr:MAG: diaminopimelate decarboxylase [Omnitrophica bacterium RIFCSPHIGHO2_02_FULL_45_28]OGW99037.1 MAG: diaminopimelate decarboxylase [Omnitrophica bacterium RIFCSPLOWO2_12_FULL_44_17]OGX04113.1 MAG: diaminopimelate decarboxylase [Omnitrophica bacterium RIFCSPLOWO2_02_FULL_44_11]